MSFEEALIAMKAGKKIKLPDRDWYLSLLEKIYFDGDSEREVSIISCEDIMSDNWETVG